MQSGITEAIQGPEQEESKMSSKRGGSSNRRGKGTASTTEEVRGRGRMMNFPPLSHLSLNNAYCHLIVGRMNHNLFHS